MCQNKIFPGVTRTPSRARRVFLDGPKLGKLSVSQSLLVQGKIVLKFEADGGDATWAHSMMYLKPLLRPTFLLMIPIGTPVMQDHVALRVLRLPPKRVGPQLLARHSWRTLVEMMIHRITPPAQTRPGPLAAAHIVASFWRMRANARRAASRR